MRLFSLIFAVMTAFSGFAQNTGLEKLSPLVRARALAPTDRSICAFILTDDPAALEANGCFDITSFGDIHIAVIPERRLGRLSALPEVRRIEAGRRCRTLIDTTARIINAIPVYEGDALPQAYNGEGVVMGIMDVGFDLTHPTFYSGDTTVYRISRLWDQITPGDGDTALPTGNEYVGRDELLSLGHSYDGLLLTHGTHTAGIAAGSGYDSPYRGIAWGSELCLVCNAVIDNAALIDSSKLDMFTTAMDALGFKYIFDYAESVGRPCVISFSEGFDEDYSDEDVLFGQVLDSLTGAGRILVASAGNKGGQLHYVYKRRGESGAGTCMYDFDGGSDIYCLARGDGPFTLRIVFYSGTEAVDSFVIASSVMPDTITHVLDTMRVMDSRYIFMGQRFPSAYDSRDTVCFLWVNGPEGIGLYGPQTAVVAEGKGAEVELTTLGGTVFYNFENTPWRSADNSHSQHLPAAYPRVISVGSTSCRDGFTNYAGVWHDTRLTGGGEGQRAVYSSVGPSLQGVMKPDVMAPGNNIVSAYSTWYEEANPTANDLTSDVARFTFNGREYAWNSNTGTSMAAPAVGGAIALWLQADPTLTPEDIMDIFAATCSHPVDTLDYPNIYYGNGLIDVYAGLLNVLGMDDISSLSRYQPRHATITPSEGTVVITFDEAPTETVRVIIYDTGGRRVECLTAAATGSRTYRVPFPHRGVYAVELRAGAVRGSNLIRMK